MKQTITRSLLHFAAGLMMLGQGAGLACLADSDEPSHVVKAMKPEGKSSRQMIRFSVGLENTAAEVEGALDAARRAARALRP